MNDSPSMFELPNNILSEAFSWLVYKEICNRAESIYTGNLALLVIPICLWCDATHNYTAGKFKLEP